MDLTLLDVEALLISARTIRAEFLAEEITDIDRIFDLSHIFNIIV